MDKEEESSPQLVFRAPVHAPQVEVRFIVSDSGHLVASSGAFGEFRDERFSKSFAGSTVLAPEVGTQWIAEAKITEYDEKFIKGTANAEESFSSRLVVEIKESRQGVPGTATAAALPPVTLYSCIRDYKGAGTYDVATTGNLKISVSVRLAEPAGPEKE